MAPLLERLQAPEPDPWVRRAIYEALGRIGAERSATTLIRCLDRESLEPLRAACVEALGPIGTPQALQAMLPVLLVPDPGKQAVRPGSYCSSGKPAMTC